MSTLERLYSYAKATGAAALENFTTEALAGAMRQNPRPLLFLLHDAGLLPPGPWAEAEIETQVMVPGAGILDLVLVVVTPERRRELWCEVKVHAGESGAQLDAYERHRATIPDQMRPALFTLGPRPLRKEPSIPHVTWHRLRRSITADDGAAWQDFATFLSEIRMSDDLDQPIAAGEAAAMDEFRILHGKTARLLRLACERAAERWPAMPWIVDEPTIRKKLLERLASHQQLVIGMKAARSVWLTMGVEARNGVAELVVTVETWPSATDLQREIIAVADAAGLGGEWRRTYGPWGGLRTSGPLLATGDAEGASAWLFARLEELDDAAVLPFLWGRSSP